MVTTAEETRAATGVATTSAPHESSYSDGRPGNGAAAARTEKLFAEYGRTVSVLCRALLRDRTEAEDAAQQTFLSAHRALMSGTEPREPAAWLATIARNECWARIRNRMREPLAAAELEAVATTSDPLAEAIRKADFAALWRAIEELPRQQRDALLLREFGGLSYDELASALAVSGAAVESLLFRARHRLRGRLRTVYASFAGASWVDALVRLAAGGGAPVAAKVAALGVGAVAIGGSAFVVPQAFDNHRPSQNLKRAPAAVLRRHKAAVAVERVVAPVAPKAAPVQLVTGGSHEQKREHSGRQVEVSVAGSGEDGGGQGHDRAGDPATRPVAGRVPALDRGDGGGGSSDDGGSLQDRAGAGGSGPDGGDGGGDGGSGGGDGGSGGGDGRDGGN